MDNYTTVNRVESQHLPIELKLKSTKVKSNPNAMRNKQVKKIIWQSEKETECNNILNTEDIEIELNQVLEELDNNIDENLNKFYQIMKKLAKPLVKTITINNRKKRYKKKRMVRQ